MGVSSKAYIVSLTSSHSENPVVSDSEMGRFVILLLCLAYISFPSVVFGAPCAPACHLIFYKEESLDMRCPNGDSFIVRKGENPLKIMKRECEKLWPHCTYDLDNPDLGCSAAKGLLKEYKLEPACIIHDLCYMQFGDRDKKRCDKDFRHNSKEICKHPWWNYLFGTWAISNCGTVTLTAYEVVKDHGKSNTNFHKNSQERKCKNQKLLEVVKLSTSWIPL